MKKNIMLILMMLVLAFNVRADTSGLDVSLAKYDPYPATPGQTVKVWFLVQNTGESDLKNVNLEVVEQSPFSAYGNIATKNIPLLGAHKDYLVDIDLKIDGDAVEGDNTLKVKFSYLGGSVQEKDLVINIQTRDSALNIESVQVTPDEITPGSDGILNIKVKNTGQTALTDLSMKLILQSVIGSTLVDLPFAPMDSGTERKIYLLNPQETTEFKYTLRAYPDATSKVYKIPFTLTYYDSQGNSVNKTDYVGIIINGMPELSVVIDESDLTDKKKSGTVTLKIINKGVSDIKFLNLLVGDTEEFDILSNSKSTYVGNLVSDDYQTADYMISVNSKNNKVVIPVTLQYRDSNNKYYESKYNVDLNLIDSDKIDTGKSSKSWIVILLIVGAIGGFWYYRRSKKKAKKN